MVLVFVVALEAGEASQCTDQSNAAARYHALFNGCARGVQCVFDAGFLLFHFDFGSGTDLNHGDTAGKLGDALLQLLAVVVAGGFFDLRLDLLDAAFDRFLVAGAINQGAVLFGDLNFFRGAQILERRLLQ